MYNQLFTQILDSSVWLAPDPARLVWITLLASMDQEGFAAFSAIGNLAGRARVSLEDCKAAVQLFESPDPESGDPANEGRRIERVPGGWMILNAPKYKAIISRSLQREQTRRRVADYRARHGNAHVTTCNTDVTPSDADADADANAKKSPRAQSTPPAAIVPAQALEGELLPKGRKRASETGTRLPDDFQLTADMTAVAMAEGVNPRREFARFCDYWRALPGQRGRKADWLATWRNWCRRSADGGHSRAPAPQLKSAAELEREARARGEDPDELESERAARLAASPQGELYAHLLKPMAPRPEYRPDPGAVAVDSGVRGVQGLVRRG